MNEELRNENLEVAENNSRKGLGAALIGGALAIGGLVVFGVSALKKRKKSNQSEETPDPEAEFEEVEEVDDSEK